MPRLRNKENRGLPARWRHFHGAYYYHVPRGLEELWEGKKQFRLGSSLPEAYRTWADRVTVAHEARTIGQLLDRYAAEVVPTKALTTQAGNALHIAQLRRVFGRMAIAALRPRHIYGYVDKRDA